MRRLNLIERLDGRDEPPTALEHVVDVRTGASANEVLKGVARALHEATNPRNTARRAMLPPAVGLPAAQSPTGPGESRPITPPHAEHATETEPMPLVFTARSLPQAIQRPPAHQGWRQPSQYSAHALLGIALVSIALLMTAPLPDLARSIGLDLPGARPRPKLARLIDTQAPDLTQTFIAPSVGSRIDEAFTVTSLEDQVLLERCEVMIARGEVRQARDELAQAASDGRLIARFALAETFDPNVLAAWGLRENNIADPAIARTLYRQALEAGDHRAEARLAALAVETPLASAK